jgi:drug/metabolite transporter (DMT)-like permease
MKKALLQLHLAVFLAGFTGILGVYITLQEGLLVFYRVLLTCAILIAYQSYRGVLQRVNWRAAVPLLCNGALLALHWVAFYGSLKKANVSIGLVCLSASSFFAAILEAIVFKKRVKVTELVLSLIALLGIYIIFDFHRGFKIGIIYGVISAALAAAAAVFSKKSAVQHTTNTVVVYQMVGAVLALLVFLPLYFYKYPVSYWLPTSNDWYGLAFLVIICTIWCFYLQTNALKTISAFTVSLSYNLEPIYGILLAFVCFNEQKALHANFYIGLGIIAATVVAQVFRLQRTKVKA